MRKKVGQLLGSPGAQTRSHSQWECHLCRQWLLGYRSAGSPWVVGICQVPRIYRRGIGCIGIVPSECWWRRTSWNPRPVVAGGKLGIDPVWWRACSLAKLWTDHPPSEWGSGWAWIQGWLWLKSRHRCVRSCLVWAQTQSGLPTWSGLQAPAYLLEIVTDQQGLVANMHIKKFSPKMDIPIKLSKNVVIFTCCH